MITDGLLMMAVILALACGIIVLEKHTGWKMFTYVPGMVIMYLLCAALNTAGLFGEAEATRAPIGEVADVLLPAMIFLFLFGCDLRRIIKLGPRLLATFFTASASLFVAMVVIFAIFSGALDPESWKVFGALLASWTGGSANMVAVQGILHAPENIFGYALITDTIMYSIWLMVLFGSVGFAHRFNRFTKADTSYLDVHGAEEEDGEPATKASLSIAIFGSLAVSIAALKIGELLPTLGAVVNATTWTILIVSVLGLIVAVTPLGRTAGSSETAGLMLYIVIGNIASGSDFSAITQAPLYLVVGACVLATHAVIMLTYAKLTHTDLFTIAVASAANVGGPASAPVVAAAYHKQLIPIGVLFALMGAFLGTFIGLAGAQVMGAI